MCDPFEEPRESAGVCDERWGELLRDAVVLPVRVKEVPACTQHPLLLLREKINLLFDTTYGSAVCGSYRTTTTLNKHTTTSNNNLNGKGGAVLCALALLMQCCVSQKTWEVEDERNFAFLPSLWVLLSCKATLYLFMFQIITKTNKDGSVPCPLFVFVFRRISQRGEEGRGWSETNGTGSGWS